MYRSVLSGLHCSQCFESDTNSDSDCELADLLLVVVASQLKAYVNVHVFMFILLKLKTCV